MFQDHIISGRSCTAPAPSYVIPPFTEGAGGNHIFSQVVKILFSARFYYIKFNFSCVTRMTSCFLCSKSLSTSNTAVTFDDV